MHLNYTHLHTCDGGVLVSFNHSVVGLHIHQSQQSVLPPASLQNLEKIVIPCGLKETPELQFACLDKG